MIILRYDELPPAWFLGETIFKKEHTQIKNEGSLVISTITKWWSLYFQIDDVCIEIASSIFKRLSVKLNNTLKSVLTKYIWGRVICSVRAFFWVYKGSHCVEIYTNRYQKMP